MNTQRIINLNWLWLALLIIILDQLAKFFITSHIAVNNFVFFTPFFNLTHLHNTGAAFSFLESAGKWHQWLLSGIASIVSIFILCWIYTLPPKRKWLATALSLILGGALGNLIDRFVRGYVVDFLDFHYKIHHWPPFNFADSMVVIGTIMLIIEFIFREKQLNRQSQKH